MLVRILRRLTLEEVEEQLRDLEESYGMSFGQFEEQLLTEKMKEKYVDTYFKWARLVHAYRGYMEDGELHCVVEELHDLSSDEVKMFTPKRLELLYALSNLRVESINDLARKVRRDVKNVYQDLQALKKLGLVNLNRKKGRKVVPEVLVEEITFITQ
jgi:DNA-binding transcriptional ArsR family regulator